MPGISHNPVAVFQVPYVWLIEQAKTELDPQDIPYSAVQCLHRDGSLIDKLSQWENIGVWRPEGASDIEACLHALPDRFLHVGGYVML